MESPAEIDLVRAAVNHIGQDVWTAKDESSDFTSRTHVRVRPWTVLGLGDRVALYRERWFGRHYHETRLPHEVSHSARQAAVWAADHYCLTPGDTPKVL